MTKEKLIEQYRQLRIERYNASLTVDNYTNQMEKAIKKCNQLKEAVNDWQRIENQKAEELERLEYQLEELGVYVYEI